jgi:hypothetical protein
LHIGCLALLLPQDVALWHKLAEMSLENGFIRQAIYCYNKVRVTSNDMSFLNLLPQQPFCETCISTLL